MEKKERCSKGSVVARQGEGGGGGGSKTTSRVYIEEPRDTRRYVIRRDRGGRTR